MYNFIICHWHLHVVVLSHLYAAKVIVAIYDYLWNIMIIVMVRQSRNVLIRRSDGFIMLIFTLKHGCSIFFSEIRTYLRE